MLRVAPQQIAPKGHRKKQLKYRKSHVNPVFVLVFMNLFTLFWMVKPYETLIFDDFKARVSPPPLPVTTWLFNIAMENDPFIDDFPS